MKYAIWALGIVVILALVAASQDSGEKETPLAGTAPGAPPGVPEQPKGPSLHLNRPFYFQVEGKDDLAKLEVGWYLVKPEGDTGIRFKAADGDAEYVLVTAPLTHEEKLDEPAAAVYECGDDVAKVVFLRPGGKGLCARGSHSGARVRGAEEEVLKYIFADAQQPATWGAIPAAAKILRVYPQQLVWSTRGDAFASGCSLRNGIDFRTRSGGKSPVAGTYILPLPPGSAVLQLRLMASDQDPQNDWWALLTRHQYDTERYAPSLAHGLRYTPGYSPHEFYVCSSGVLDWAWRTEMRTMPGQPGLTRDEVYELVVGTTINPIMLSSLRHVDVVYIPPG